MIYLVVIGILVMLYLYSELLRLRKVLRLFKQEQIELQQFLDTFAE